MTTMTMTASAATRTLTSAKQETAARASRRPSRTTRMMVTGAAWTTAFAIYALLSCMGAIMFFLAPVAFATCSAIIRVGTLVNDGEVAELLERRREAKAARSA
jgi:hypothetical protein